VKSFGMVLLGLVTPTKRPGVESRRASLTGPDALPKSGGGSPRIDVTFGQLAP